MRLPNSRRRTAEPSYGITTADSSHLSDISKRQRQYVYTMLFRVVAILVVVLVPGLTLMVRVVLGLVATVIPYVAVVRANGGPDRGEAPTNLMVGGPRQTQLPGPDRSLGGGGRIDGHAESGDADHEDTGREDAVHAEAAGDGPEETDAAGAWIGVEAVWADAEPETATATARVGSAERDAPVTETGSPRPAGTESE